MIHKADKAKLALKGKKRLLILVGLTVVIVVFIAVSSWPQERSVAAYCKAYKEAESQLAKSNGKTYGSKIFTARSSNPHDFVVAFEKLEKAAPDEVHEDVKTLKEMYQKIDDDPTQEFAAGLSGITPEQNLKEWTTENCRQ